MIRWVIGSSLKLPFIVIALAAAMMYFGLAQLRDMPVDVFPEFAPPRVELQTEAPGLSTVETEEILTITLEQALAGTPGLDVLRSKTVPGLSSIELIFKPGTDIWLARQLVQERLNTVDLPTAVGVPIMLPPLSSTSRALFIGLSSDELSLIELSDLVFWKIRPRLLRVPGVANVATWGDRLHQLQVQVDPALLQAHGVSVQEVMDVTSDALASGILPYSSSWVPGAGGWIETPNQRLSVSHILPINDPEELAQVPVRDRKKSDGTPLLLGDLGDVVLDHPPLIGDAVVNDGPGLLLIVEKFPWGNTLEVTREVEAALEEMRPGLTGVEMDTTIFRPATFIETSIDNLTKALIIASVLVMLILVLFIFEWRVALISLVAIPLSLMAAALVLSILGATINVMILAGLVIAIGAVVDDAIIDVENIVRRLRQYRSEGTDKSTAKIILEASLEVRSAIVYATLIEVVAVSPVFFLGGLSGSFFQPLALAYALAVGASMLVALTVTPAMSLLLLSRAPLKRREPPVVRWLHRAYGSVLRPIVRRPRSAFLGVGAIMLVGVAVLPQLGEELLPDFKENDFLMHWITSPGTSHPEMLRITTEASEDLRAIPGVRNFGAHIGRALNSDEVVGINFTENWVSVDPDADYDATVAAIQATVDEYPGLQRDVQTYLKERIKEVLTGSSEAIVVRIYGPDLDVLRSKAEEVRQNLSEIDGIVDLHTELEVDIAQVEIEVDLAKAGRYGLKPGDIRRAAAAMIASTEVGDFYTKTVGSVPQVSGSSVSTANKAFDVSVWSTPDTRHSLTSLRELPIDTPDGGRVRLGDVADVRVVSTPNEIEHENTARRIDVLANVSGRDLGSVAGDVERALTEVEFPLEYRVELLGEYAERQAAQRRLFVLAGVAAIAIFLLLLASFGSWRLAILSFVTLPAALVGGLVGAYIGGGIVSLGSLVGFFTVLGISARNGIMLINHYQHLELYEGEVFGPGLVLRGARERIAPILMTASTTGLALVPLVIAGDIAGHEIEHPLAVVILGGLVTSTLLNLFIIPPLYLMVGRFGRDRSSPFPGSVG
ncbi:MAG: efflux RND transporter permease subunit [Chloroflexi bacterium]|nr:efflux RND transporter permease subunit [Chloroflexota bacterium]